jgi:serine/threonine protein phosphatase PrpC
MAIVCDGHGGEPYFRSQYGSQFAVEIAKKAIRSFVDSMEDSSFTVKGKRSVFEDKPFTDYGTNDGKEHEIDNHAHKALMWLFSSIISQWNDRIAKDACERDLDEWEQIHVDQKYKDDFHAKQQDPSATFEKIYGCTLMAYVQTPTYWFAFHIGDGKFVTVHNEGNGIEFRQPIPWDERCFLNKTTSLCDSHVLEEFRYCYQGDGSFPRAVFLGSDGMDDSYGDGDNLYNFYTQLFKIIIRKGNEKALDELKKSLPIISKRGSKDDMSVACVYDDTALSAMFFAMTDYQGKMLDEQFAQVGEKVLQLTKKIEDLGNPEKLEKKDQIELEYAKKDLTRVADQAVRIKRRMAVLKGEITKYRNRLKNLDADTSPFETDSSFELTSE